MSALSRLPALLVVVLLGVAPEVAEACAVCMAGRDEQTRVAFLLTTIFLSVLPLAMLGAGIWWVVRRLRALEADAGEPAPDGAPTAGARS